MNKPLEYIDILNTQEFEANGKTYFLEPHMSIERYEISNKLELEIAYATTFKKMHSDMKEVFGLLNENKLANAAVQLNDMIQGVQRIDDKSNHHPVMKYCTLIFNTKDEDRRSWDEKAMDEKINDWKEAGIPITSFFAVVLRSVPGLLPIWREIFQDTSPEKNEQKQN